MLASLHIRNVISFVVVALPALCQQASITSLVGTVNDSAGAAVPNAQVRAVNEGTGEVYSGLTNQQGSYAFQFVRIGSYAVTASAPNFDTVIHKGVVVDVNQVVRTDFVLAPGKVSEQITVSAVSPPIATDDASVSEVITNRAVADLPLNGRDALRLATTVPGVIAGMKSQTGSTAAGGEDFIGAGVREVQNSISLDGVSIVSNLITTTALRPSVDAIQEFQVQTGTYSAQYGTVMGVHLNVITKSGTNALHGSVWEFLRNDHLDARGFFEQSTSPKAPFHLNQFGTEVDGPVFLPKLYNGKNRTFFMFTYEGERQTQTVTSLAAVLTARMRQGDFSEIKAPVKNPLANFAPFPNNTIPPSALSPLAFNILKYMPEPNLPGTSNNYSAGVRNGNTTNQVIARVDENLSETSRLFFRYVRQGATLLEGNTNPFNGFNVPINDNNYAAGYTRTFSPRAVNDFRLGYESTTYRSLNFFTSPSLANAGTALGIPGFTTGPDNPGIAEFDISGYVAIGGQNMTSSNWYRPDTTLQFTNVFNYTAGAHSIATGAEFYRLTTGSQGFNSSRGLFTFGGGISGNAAADFMLGYPLQVTTPAVAQLVLARQWRDAFFVSDKWDVAPKLTLTLGLRYELPAVAESPNGHIRILNKAGTALIPEQVPASISLTDPQHTAFAPRVGFAWRVARNWVVRGGAGIYYNANQMNSYTLGGSNPPFASRLTYNSPQTKPTLTLADPVAASSVSAIPPPNISTVNQYLPLATMNQWSFDVERALWSGAGLDIQYIGSHSYHLDRSYFNNSPLPGPGPVNARYPNPLWGVIRTIQNDEIANYDGLNVILRQRLNHGLTTLLSYTWSHTLDVSTDSNNSGAPQDPYNWKGDYGNSNWDIRHRFVASYSYALPLLTNLAAWKRALLGGWQLNGITTFQSGLPFAVSISGDVANTGVTPQRPN